MRYLVAGLMLISLKSFGSEQDVRNINFIQEKNDICNASKCSACGQFFYYPNGSVGYASTTCEDLYVITQMDQDRIKEDADIRRKYAGEIKK